MPDAIRQALFWIAAISFVAAQTALLVSALSSPDPRRAAPVRGRFGRGPELLMVLLPAALTLALLSAAWRALGATGP